jgi:hypothetical protein
MFSFIIGLQVFPTAPSPQTTTFTTISLSFLLFDIIEDVYEWTNKREENKPMKFVI